MAVVQISRIQIRRGQKNSQTGFPQLASGELGWAIDTQELYIGNGAVSEGSPYVGNSKILTEHDNILDFTNSYQYRRNDPTIQTGYDTYTPVQRSLQDRLDDIVSVKAFGATGDGITDDTAALQRAIDQLFLSTATILNSQKREILFIDPGKYIISDELRIPSYAHITGAGIDSTIITQTSNKAVIRTVDDRSTPGNYIDFHYMYSPDRPKFLYIEGLTLSTQTAYPIAYIDNLDSSKFERVKFYGTWVNGDIPATDVGTGFYHQVGIYLRGTSGVLRPRSVLFHSCYFQKVGVGAYSISDHVDVGFDQCNFYQLYDGVNLGGGQFGSSSTKITNNHFDLVDQYGIWIKQGSGNISSGNTFINVGCDSQGYENAIYPIIKFDVGNNKSVGDYFERSARLKDQNLYGTIAYIPNVSDYSLYQDTSGRRTTINELSTTYVAMRIPVYQTGTFIIDYVINKTTNGNAVRTGKLRAVIGSIVLTTTTVLQDEYTYTGSSTVENIIFSIILEDKNSDGLVDTMSIYISNPPSDVVPSNGGGSATLNYSYYTLTQ